MVSSNIVRRPMKIRKAYKFRLKTNEEIEKSLWTYVGHCRFIWNYFWRLNQERLLKRQRIMRYYEMDFWSKLLKQSEEYGFLGEAPSQSLQQKLKDLDRAYTDGFDRKQPHKRLPTQRKKQIHSSFRWPCCKYFLRRVEGDSLLLYTEYISNISLIRRTSPTTFLSYIQGMNCLFLNIRITSKPLIVA